MSGTTVSPWNVAVTTVLRRLSSLVRCVAFWTAVVFPFVLLPVVVLDPSRLVDFRLLGSLLSVNLVALVLGHRHRDAETERDASTR